MTDPSYDDEKRRRCTRGYALTKTTRGTGDPHQTCEHRLMKTAMKRIITNGFGPQIHYIHTRTVITEHGN